MPAFTLDDTIVASSQQVSADLSGEAVILSLPQGVYFGVDGVAARIWALVQKPARLSTVAETLVAEFDVTAEQCARDVLAFASQLAEQGLVDRVGDGVDS